ncbi:MAG: ABC transporter ATP-binding protein, partial [Clostridiales bacterium]|nr:ABC transporter ATP-binding protein [Clostridiales bacterium]
GITAGSILMFVNLMNFLIPPVSELPKLFAGKKAAAGLIEKLSDSLSQNAGDAGTEEVSEVGEKISFRNVSFAYEEGEKEVLHDINCDLLPGRSYAVVGGSGSGKSTFLNLLMAANNEYKGEISIDGKELRSIRPESLYDLMSVISQNVFIFNSSIKDNVTMFRDFPKEKIESAMHKAHLEALVSERGEDYLCGENGKGLSGGEKQRISIARSLLKDSSILLADEATSALDAKTSYEVINEILELDSMTRVVVTHSLEESLLRRYDEIIVIKDGTIEEKGSFQDLMRKDGYFKALYTVAG